MFKGDKRRYSYIKIPPASHTSLLTLSIAQKKYGTACTYATNSINNVNIKGGRLKNTFYNVVTILPCQNVV